MDKNCSFFATQVKMRSIRYHQRILLLLFGTVLCAVPTLIAAFAPSFGTRVNQSELLRTTQRSSPVSSFLDRRTTSHLYTSSNPSDETTIPKEWKGEILTALSTIIDPDLNRDIVTLGFVQNLSLDSMTRQVSFDVELTTPACPIKDQFKSQCESIVNDMAWTNGQAQVTMTAPPPSQTETDVYGLSGVKHIIAVSSCKGGVGKSTTAVNLAYSLSSLGASVGIFDADVYGPSLPTMIEPDNDAVQFVGRQIAPLSRNGVKLMSFGYVNEGSAVMRGPMVTQLLDQFLSLTYWGNLDYLILDMPPGTGDIQLTLTQKMNITAAVIVTTPQELSYVDVERGIEMFDSVQVPCISVVENMAYLEDEVKETSEEDEIQMRDAFVEALKKEGIESTASDALVDSLVQVARESLRPNEKKDNQVRIFGEGHKKRLSNQWGIEHTYSVPLMRQIASNGDSGTPFVLEFPDSPQADIYQQLASTVVRETVKIQYARENERPTVVYNGGKHMLEIFTGGEEGVTGELPPAELRRDCKCAECVEELSGRQILQPEDVPDSVMPIKMVPTGNYALSVDWSDGHRSLYPYRQIRSLLLEKASEQTEIKSGKEEAVSA